MEDNKKVSLVKTVLFTVCSILVLDSFVAPAIIGVSSITIWIVTAIVFFIPYGLLSAELGSTYPDDGGIVSWVDRAFGEYPSVLVGWMYWINVAFWMPAVFTAFSGSHQDAIKKGLEARQVAADRAGADLDSFVWLVPYLPIDPKDIGRTYEAIIRVNSQSGKGGMAYLLKTNHNLDLPKRLQVEFEKVVQNYADETKKEVKDEDIWRLFKDEYLPVEQSGMTAAGVVVGDTHDATLAPWGRLKLLKVAVSSGEDGSDTVLKARVLDRGVNVGVDEPHEREISGIGNGPIAAFLNAVSNLGIEASVMDYVEHTMSVGTDAMAASYVECQVGEDTETQIIWGVGIDSSITTSALKAIISAINRSQR